MDELKMNAKLHTRHFVMLARSQQHMRNFLLRLGDEAKRAEDAAAQRDFYMECAREWAK
jgi:hypothetical protein